MIFMFTEYSRINKYRNYTSELSKKSTFTTIWTGYFKITSYKFTKNNTIYPWTALNDFWNYIFSVHKTYKNKNRIIYTSISELSKRFLFTIILLDPLLFTYWLITTHQTNVAFYRTAYN